MKRLVLLAILLTPGCGTIFIDTIDTCSVDTVKIGGFTWRWNLNCSNEIYRTEQRTNAMADRFDKWVILDRFSKRRKNNETGEEEVKLFLVIQPVGSTRPEDIMTVEVTGLPPQLMPDTDDLKDRFPEYDFDIEEGHLEE